MFSLMVEYHFKVSRICNYLFELDCRHWTRCSSDCTLSEMWLIHWHRKTWIPSFARPCLNSVQSRIIFLQFSHSAWLKHMKHLLIGLESSLERKRYEIISNLFVDCLFINFIHSVNFSWVMRLTKKHLTIHQSLRPMSSSSTTKFSNPKSRLLSRIYSAIWKMEVKWFQSNHFAIRKGRSQV